MLKSMHGIALLTGIAASFVVGSSARADTIIGNFEGGSTDGWIDWGTQAAVAAPKYVVQGNGATLGTGALQLTVSGFNQNLAIKLQDTSLHPDYRPDFFANNAIQLDFTVPADGQATSGFAQLFEFAINAQGYGFVGQGTNPLISFGFPNGSPQTATLTVPYGHLIDGDPGNGEIAANPSHIEFIIATNSDNAAHGVFYFDNIRLTVIPEPASMGAIALAGLALAARRRRA